jgi:hypothetical protein
MKENLCAIMAILMVLFFANSSALANNWDPTKKTIEIVVPYPPGGTADKVGRQLTEIFTVHGWKSIVLNKPGADTVIGANYVAVAKPDGYTLYLGGNGFIDANIAFDKKAPGIEYTENSFAPIVFLGHNTLFLIAPANSPVNSYEEFRTYVRRNPNKFNLGFWNSYTANIFHGWARLDGLPSPSIINYRGSAPLMLDIMGGNLNFAFDAVTNIKQPYQSGKIKILAALTKDGITDMKSIDPALKIPNLSQQYLDLNLNIWYGLYAPAGTDPTIIKEINQLINLSLKDKKFIDSFSAMDISGQGGSPQDLKRVQAGVLNQLRNVAKNIE